MRYAFVAFIFLLIATLTEPASATTGFVKPPNDGYVQLTFDTFSSRDLYLTNGELLDLGTEFTQQNVSLYGEYGLTSYLTVGFHAPLARLNSFEMSDTGLGFGDLSIFAKAGLTMATVAFALTVAPEFPTGRDEILVDDGFGGRVNLPTGDGEFSTWFRVSASRSFSFTEWLNAYVSAHTGYNLRAKWADQIAVGGEVGVSLFGWMRVQGRLDALFSPTPVEDLNPEGIFLYAEGTEYVAAEGALAVRIPSTPLWLNVGLRNTFANLRNLYAGTTVSVALAAEW